MASNSASPFRVELRDVEDLQGPTPSTSKPPSVARIRPAVAHSSTHAVPSALDEIAPFAALRARLGRPLRVAILSDFTRIPYANGAAFQTRFLYQELRRCGHQVTLIGPRDPDSTAEELPEGTIELPSLPLKMYPGVHLPLPLERWVYDASRWDFDLVFAQTTSMLMEFGVWLRKMKGIPLLCVNTTHLVAAYDVLLPEKLSKIELVHAGLELTLKRPFEKTFADIYNNSDGLVVLSDGLRSYWRECGVKVPIHVIGRAVQPEIFDKPLGPDPFGHLSARATRGPRLLCAGRHTREKSQDRVIRIFAKYVVTEEPNATLTVLGEGPDTEYYKRVARELGVADRVFFPGEVPFTRMPDYYAYSDIFVHGSLSETYGNVLGEALWCGTPTVAFFDGMGVSAQIEGGVNGVLVDPGRDDQAQRAGDASFGRSVVELLRDHPQRARLGRAAARRARERSSPRAVQQKLADAFMAARDHAARSGLRPALAGTKARQWYTTFRHFRSWTTVMSGLYVIGHFRKPPAKKAKSQLHPQIGS